MRKLLLLLLSVLLLLFCFAGTAAAAKSAGAEIPVTIEGGGTAYVISEVNSPVPSNSTIRVDNGRTGRLNMNFTEPGVYHYTIKAEFNEDGMPVKADEIYRVTVKVYAQDDGALYTVTTINSNQSKEPEVRFERRPPPTTQPPTTQPPTSPGTPPATTKPSNQPKPRKQPRTGDETHLQRYVLVAVASSLGLFLVAMLYTVNTNKLIREEYYD